MNKVLIFLFKVYYVTLVLIAHNRIGIFIAKVKRKLWVSRCHYHRHPPHMSGCHRHIPALTWAEQTWRAACLLSTFWFPIHSLPLESENLGPESKCSILYYLKCKNKQVFNSLEEKDVYTMCTRSQRFLRKHQARDVCKWKLFLFMLNNAKLGVWRPGETVNCGVFLCSLDYGCPVMGISPCVPCRFFVDSVKKLSGATLLQWSLQAWWDLGKTRWKSCVYKGKLSCTHIKDTGSQTLACMGVGG